MYLAYIDASSERAERWNRNFGGDCVPVISDRPYPATLDDDVVRLFYKADWAALTPEYKELVTADFAKHCNISIEEALTEIEGEHGVPICAEGVYVVNTDETPRKAAEKYALCMKHGWTLARYIMEAHEQLTAHRVPEQVPGCDCPSSSDHRCDVNARIAHALSLRVKGGEE